MSDETPNVIVIAPADKVDFPAWYYGPKGEAEIFESAGDVPKGWLDHPQKAKTKTVAAKAAEPVDPPVTDAVVEKPLEEMTDEELEAVLKGYGYEVDGAARADIIAVILDERSKA